MLITVTRPNSSPVRIYINPAKPDVEETEYVSCFDGVVRAGKSDYKTTLAITGDTLHIWTNAEYYFYVAEYKAKRPDTSNYNALEAVNEWVKTGRGLFSLGAMDVYIDNIDRTLEIYVIPGTTVKTVCEGVTLRVLGALSG